MIKAITLIVLMLLAALPLAAASAQDTYSSLYEPGRVDQMLVTLDSGGNATWLFSEAFASTPAVAHFPKQMDANNPLICNFTAISANGVSIHCWRTNVLGLLSGLLGGNATGAQVNVIARAVN